jgi:hypothetical protein
MLQLIIVWIWICWRYGHIIQDGLVQSEIHFKLLQRFYHHILCCAVWVQRSMSCMNQNSNLLGYLGFSLNSFTEMWHWTQQQFTQYPIKVNSNMCRADQLLILPFALTPRVGNLMKGIAHPNMKELQGQHSLYYTNSWPFISGKFPWL